MAENTFCKWLIADLKEHPRQAELFRDLPNEQLKALAADIEANELHEPVEIRPSGILIAGHQRVKAARLLGWTEIDVEVRNDLEEQGEKAINIRMIESNLNRRQMGPLDIARSFKALKELQPRTRSAPGTSQKQLRDKLAQILGDKSGRTLDRHLKILETPRQVQDAFSSGELTMGAALKVATLPQQVQKNIAEKIQAGSPAKSVVAAVVTTKFTDLEVAAKAYRRIVRDLQVNLDLLVRHRTQIAGKGLRNATAITVITAAMDLLKNLLADEKTLHAERVKKRKVFIGDDME